MRVEYVSPRVRDAVLSHDLKNTSLLGRKGAQARKAKKIAKLNFLLAGAMEMIREGNEDTCPIDD